jgi:hypothetical protein
MCLITSFMKKAIPVLVASHVLVQCYQISTSVKAVGGGKRQLKKNVAST